MSLVESPAETADLSETIRVKIQNAAGPLTLADLAKPKPNKLKMTSKVYQDKIRKLLDEQVALGLVFCQPSGKNGAARFWDKDEKHLIRSKAVEFATTPQALAAMTKNLVKSVKGVDKGYVETIVRELDGDGELFEYPPAKKNAAPRFGATPPPPPAPALEQPKHKKSFDKLVENAGKLLAAAQVPVDELLGFLRARLAGPTSRPTEASSSAPYRVSQIEAKSSSVSEIEDLIMKEVENSPAVSLADLRANLPAELRGPAFDAAILRLADAERISVHADAEPSSFSDEERAQYVQDGQHLYTAITKRGK